MTEEKLADNISGVFTCNDIYGDYSHANDDPHFCVDTDGQLYAWGLNYYGVFGKGRMHGYREDPVTVSFPND